ncbi:MAG: hypothetical protein OQK58_05890 [Gammaproteobacteria bacterium]|nr:hypothetical protein [Gammaproteobacteria bacterium]
MKKIVLLSGLSVALFTGCHPYGGGIIIDDGYSHSPYVAPAHRRPFHRYYYYPNAEIYFDVGRNTYFYLNSAGAWTFSVNLPVHLRSHLHNGYVEVEMEHDRPYLRHKYYKNKYQKHKIYKRTLNNGPQYNNDRNYRNDGILRQNPKNQEPKRRDPQRYEQRLDNREHKNERKYDERQFRNERKYDERKYKNEQKYKENKGLKKQEKYEKDDGNNKQEMKSRRNDLY